MWFFVLFCVFFIIIFFSDLLAASVLMAYRFYMRSVTSQVTESVSSTCSLSGSTYLRASALQVFCLVDLTWGCLGFCFCFKQREKWVWSCCLFVWEIVTQKW